jgi:hypothetical protein
MVETWILAFKEEQAEDVSEQRFEENNYTYERENLLR